MPSTRNLHFVQGKRLNGSRYWEFRARTEKICATENAVSLGQAQRNSPDEGKERPDPSLNYLSAATATTGGSHGARISPGNPMNE